MPYVFDTDSVVKYSAEEEANSNILNSDDKVSKVIQTILDDMTDIWILFKYPASVRTPMKNSVNNLG